MKTSASVSIPTERHTGLDSLRGLAIVAMVAYHFAFDLHYFKLIEGNPYHSPVWIAARTAILSSFLLISGLSFVLANSRARSPAAFWRRWAQLAGCAALVTAGSMLMFPASYITFGVLHAIAAMWLIAVFAKLAITSAYLLSAIGLMLIATGLTVKHAVFDPAWLNWLGMTARKPRTEDYVPLLPWMGVFVIGMAAGRSRLLAIALDQPLRHAWLTWLGQHSLSVYMLHQPLLIGGLWLLVRFCLT